MPIKKKRKKRTIADSDAVDITLARFSRNERGELMSASEVAKKFDRDSTQIPKIIDMAFKKDLVSVQVRHTGPKRNTTLEKDLKKHYHLLDAVVVRDTDLLEALRTLQIDRRKFSDDVHARIGVAAASAITGLGVDDGDCVGLSSGRAVFSAVNHLRHLTPSGARQVTLRSLCGDVHARFHWKALVLSLVDADTHVSMMGTCFLQPPTLQVISRPIAYADMAERDVARSSTCLSLRSPLTRAIVGVGAFTTGHQFYEAAMAKTQSVFDEIVHKNGRHKTTRRLLMELEAACDAMETDDWCPVGDVGNYLFCVPPPQGKSFRPSEVPKKIQKLVGQINDRTLTVQKHQLQGIPILLCAGTLKKAAAIRWVIDPKGLGLNVRYICTDGTTADRLLEFEQISKV